MFAGTAQGEDARPPSPVTPLLFFEGTTESIGTMSVAMHRSTSTHSRGVGTIARDGSLSLVQIVQDEGRAPYARRWSVRQVGPGQFTGSMSQATGPVTIQQVGSRFRFEFMIKGALSVEESLRRRGRPLGDQRGDRQQVRYSCGHIPRPGAQAAVVNIGRPCEAPLMEFAGSIHANLRAALQSARRLKEETGASRYRRSLGTRIISPCEPRRCGIAVIQDARNGDRPPARN